MVGQYASTLISKPFFEKYLPESCNMDSLTTNPTQISHHILFFKEKFMKNSLTVYSYKYD